MRRPEVSFNLDLEEEYDAPENQFEDPETIAWVHREIEHGNEWAWFCAKVTAQLEVEGKIFKGTNYLGGCSYESRESFLQRDGYWPQLQRDALEDLTRRLSREDGPDGEEVRVPLSKTVKSALAEAALHIELYERGLRVADDAPASRMFSVIDRLGIPCYLEKDKGACRVMFDVLYEQGLVVEAGT